MLSLVLSGGGARGAYQAGVIEALTEIAKQQGLARLFPIVTGVSAGAINSAFYAARAQDPTQAARSLSHLWSTIRPESVFRTDPISLGGRGARLVSDLSFGGLHRRATTNALLDTSPLVDLIESNIDFNQIEKNIENGDLFATAVTATQYRTSSSISFVQARSEVPMWKRVKRQSVPVQLRTEHIMASSAIPLFFPPVPVGEQYFGDGCVRNTTPLSPAIHLGSQYMILVGVRKAPSGVPSPEVETSPTLARLLSVLLDSIFLDGADIDVERLLRINQTLAILTPDQQKDYPLKPLHCLWILPSQDVGAMAREYSQKIPRVLRYLIRGLGSLDEAAQLISYLLFDSAYCTRLVQLGYDDTKNRSEEVIEFFAKAAAHRS